MITRTFPLPQRPLDQYDGWHGDQTAIVLEGNDSWTIDHSQREERFFGRAVSLDLKCFDQLEDKHFKHLHRLQSATVMSVANCSMVNRSEANCIGRWTENMHHGECFKDSLWKCPSEMFELEMVERPPFLSTLTTGSTDKYCRIKTDWSAHVHGY